jgi:hypothetical protein
MALLLDFQVASDTARTYEINSDNCLYCIPNENSFFVPWKESLVQVPFGIGLDHCLGLGHALEHGHYLDRVVDLDLLPGNPAADTESPRKYNWKLNVLSSQIQLPLLCRNFG